MKKITFLILLLVGFDMLAQESDVVTEIKKNELKINALMFVAGAVDITYERLLNQDAGVGLTVLTGFSKESNLKFSVSPYYRLYLGKKYGAGFFAEGFGMFNVFENNDLVYNGYYFDSILNQNIFYSNIKVPVKKISDFAVGFGLGGKWITKRNVFFEVSFGVGRNLFNSDLNKIYENEIVVKFGTSIGYSLIFMLMNIILIYLSTDIHLSSHISVFEVRFVNLNLSWQMKPTSIPQLKFQHPLQGVFYFISNTIVLIYK